MYVPLPSVTIDIVGVKITEKELRLNIKKESLLIHSVFLAETYQAHVAKKILFL